MNWLTWEPFHYDGWSLTVPVLAWIVLSSLAVARFAPQVRRAWRTWRDARRQPVNGGAGAIVALESLGNLGVGLTVSLLCLLAALLAMRRNGLAVLPLLVIPAVKLVHAEAVSRIHARLLRALAVRERL